MGTRVQMCRRVLLFSANTSFWGGGRGVRLRGGLWGGLTVCMVVKGGPIVGADTGFQNGGLVKPIFH